jgi:hypothetical protein
MMRATRGAGRAAASFAGLPSEYLAEGVTAEEFVARPAARRGVAPVGALDFSYELASGEAAVLAIRHASGALTFHPPVESASRGAKQAASARFAVDVRSVDVGTGRRGAVSQAIKGILIKIGKAAGDKAASWLLPKLAAVFEKAAWEKSWLTEGWFQVTGDTLASGTLRPGSPNSTERTLLFLHGTFSHAASAFGALAQGGFFDRVAAIYADRIFAFNHFTVSRTPLENARMLLADLKGPVTFDVITHSRGGLVLRTLVECAADLGAAAGNFKLGRAVLVASPNDGTPLASPQRWQDTVGWVANLLELFPENPFTTGAEFVANGIVWLARHASGDLPGLHSMDPNGEAIADIQGPPGPPASAYSALVSNYNPSANVLSRMIDAGVDQFFQTANDLVVPSEGGWRVDHSGVTYIPADRIGCFGPGGNLANPDVTHVNFFSHKETVDFLVAALAEQNHSLTPVDPAVALPSRKFLRGGAAAPETAVGPRPSGPPLQPAAPPSAVEPRPSSESAFQQETLYLSVIDPARAGVPRQDGSPHHILVATFRNASVAVEMKTKGGEAGQRLHRIIAQHHQIRDYMSGKSEQAPPLGKALIDLGKDLFEALLPEEARRLYDNARAMQTTGRLTVIFSSHDWFGDLPWEFVFDSSRQMFLATSEVNFTRNILTAVPADLIETRPLPLRILVVVAQPLGLAHLSVEQEIAVIDAGFADLKAARLVETHIILNATPDMLHRVLEVSSPPMSARAFDVVHFIGHGYFDRDNQIGYLIFQDEMGRSQQVDSRSLQEILCRRGIRLVFLNACETAEGGPVDFNSGLAQSLVAGGLPCVVANQYSVMDVSATSFAQHFYWALAHGNTVGDAARESRIAVNYSIPGANLDWAVPVVYARNPGDRLAPKSSHEEPGPAEGALARGHVARRADGARRRIGLWDMQHLISDLDEIAERLTQCQDQLAFEVASFPLGTWRRTRSAGGSYLEAEEVAKRLKKVDIGVDLLVAITGLPLSGQGAEDVYTWKDDPRVSVISLNGFLDRLQPPATCLERLVANAIADFVSGIPNHDPEEREGKVRSADDCPLFYNEARELRYVAGPLKLCPLCRKRLKASGHDRLIPTIEALLACYRA